MPRVSRLYETIWVASSLSKISLSAAFIFMIVVNWDFGQLDFEFALPNNIGAPARGT